jgi:hypothetical protein
MSREDSYGYDPMQARLMILMFTLRCHRDSKAPLKEITLPT